MLYLDTIFFITVLYYNGQYGESVWYQNAKRKFTFLFKGWIMTISKSQVNVCAVVCILNVIKASPNRTRNSATLSSPGTGRYPCLLSIVLITPHTICFTSNKALLFVSHKVKDYTTFLLFSWCVWITVSFLQKWTKNCEHTTEYSKPGSQQTHRPCAQHSQSTPLFMSELCLNYCSYCLAQNLSQHHFRAVVLKWWKF